MTGSTPRRIARRSRRRPPAGAARWLVWLAGLCLGLACGLSRADEAPTPAPPASAPGTSLTAFADTLFQNYGVEAGMSAAYTVALAQDPRGYLWIGTQDGLNRWDGYAFHHYKSLKNDPRTLVDNMVAWLHVDLRGRLWALSAKGLAVYDAAHDDFIRIDAPFANTGALQAIEQDDPDHLLLLSRRGLYSVDVRDGGANTAPRALTRVPSIPATLVTTGLRDSAGRLWISTHAGLFMRARPDVPFTKVPLSEPDEFPGALGESRDGRLWFATERALLLIDAKTGAAWEPPGGRAAVAAVHYRPNCVFQRSQDKLWICTQDGILVLDTTTGTTYAMRHDPARATSLGTGAVQMVRADRSGLVWAATNGGVSVQDPSHAGVTTLSRAGNVTNFLPLPDGRLLASDTRDRGAALNLLDTALDRVRPFQPAGQALAGLGTQDASVPLPDGGLLTGGSHGLSRWTAAGRLVEHIDTPKDVSTIHAEHGRLWIGTVTNGLWRLPLDRLDGLHAERASFAASLGDVEVTAIGDAPGGDLWVGTVDGLFRVDGRTWKASRLSARIDGRDGDVIYISSLLTAPDGRLWVGTLGGGLYVSKPGDPAAAGGLRNVGLAQGLPDENIDALMITPSRHVWACTDGGIVELSPDARALRVLGRRDGLGVLEYWTRSGAATPAGDVACGGANGMALIHPDELPVWRYRPPTWPTSVQVGDGERRSGAFADALAHPGAAPVVVPPQSNKIAVEFAALDFSNPVDNVYRYRLDGYDDRWIAADSTHRLAAYTNLKPGDYLLRLQGSNRNGEWGGEFGLAVTVLPAWYQTWWWRLLVAVMAIASAVGLHAFLTRRIQRQRRQLEVEVTRRTQEISTQKQALEDANKRLEDMSSSDPLTGLRNRRFLMQHMDGDVTLRLRRHAQSTGGPTPDMVFYMVDLDHFKSVNDIHGHAAGDAILTQIAQRLNQVKRESDYLVRWGGEEFLIVARDIDRAHAPVLAARLSKAISGQPFDIGEGTLLAKTCSIGYACFPFDRARPRALSWTDVVDVADQGLYMAKPGGRDTWVGLGSPGGDAQADDAAAFRAAVLDAPHAVLAGRLLLASGKEDGVRATLEEETRQLDREAAARAAAGTADTTTSTADAAAHV